MYLVISLFVSFIITIIATLLTYCSLASRIVPILENTTCRSCRVRTPWSDMSEPNALESRNTLMRTFRLLRYVASEVMISNID